MSILSADQLLEQLRWRYATKEFDASQTIPTSDWNALEESLVLSPSSFGLQPWHFLVITDPEKKATLLEHSWGQKQVVDCSHFVVLAAQTQIDEATVDDFLRRTSEVRGVPLDSLDGYRQVVVGFLSRMSEEEKHHWARLQTYIALGQLMSTAAVMGIDACPMEGIDPAKYDQILGLPEKGLATSVACALGYRAADDKYASLPKVRYSRESLVTRL